MRDSRLWATIPELDVSPMQEVERLAPPSRARAYVGIIRPPNSLMIGLAVVVGEAISLGSLPPFDRAFLGFLTAALMMAGTMILNDIHDVDIDRLNSPARPIPSGRITVKIAYYYAAILSATSLLSALALGVYSFLLANLAFGLMVYYNLRGKQSGVFGNMLVSFNVALPFLFGGISVSAFRPAIAVFSALAFLSNLGREVAKGITDVQGDRAHGVRTVAVLKGPRFAAIVSGGLFIASVIVSLLPPFLHLVSAWYLPIVLLSDVGFAGSSIWLVRSPTVSTARRVKEYVLFWMLLGLVAFLVGGLT